MKKTLEYKLSEELYNEFTAKDWIDYFKHKAEENNLRYIENKVGSGIKAKSKDRLVFCSLMEQFNGKEIKTMIDFLWDAPHTLTNNKGSISVFHLTGGWLSQVFNLSHAWKNGAYGASKTISGEYSGSAVKKTTITIGGKPL